MQMYLDYLVVYFICIFTVLLFNDQFGFKLFFFFFKPPISTIPNIDCTTTNVVVPISTRTLVTRTIYIIFYRLEL